jgi:antitoxin (DNA-binding transcriptional repressor) of toxin-antitoxin stability system
MSVVSVEEVQSRLPELIEALAPGEVLLITRGTRAVARLEAVPVEPPRPVFGRCKGMIEIVVEDDGHLEDWAEYTS